jgi:uncharacterized membrane protein
MRFSRTFTLAGARAKVHRSSDERPAMLPHFRRNTVTGLLTVVPLVITWAVFDFVLGHLAQFGDPLVQWLARYAGSDAQGFTLLLLEPQVQWPLAILLTVGGLYALGLMMSYMIGRRIFAGIEHLLGKLPVVAKVYHSAKQLVEVVQGRPLEGRQIVLVEFPQGMKVLAILTQVITDPDTNELLAIVYIPTAPQPITGLLETVPMDRVTPTDLTFAEAMSFVVSIGALGPDTLAYSAPTASKI